MMRRGVVPRRSQVWCGHQLALVTRPTWNLRRCLVLVARASMPACPHCQQVVVTRDGHDRHGRQRFACAHCGRDFTLRSASAFSGYRWPADVILMAVRWYLRHPLSATSVLELLAERGIDVSNRTVLRWVQTFGPPTGRRSSQAPSPARQSLVRRRNVVLSRQGSVVPVPRRRRARSGGGRAAAGPPRHRIR